MTALQWDELTNQGKGAYQPNDASYFWQFASGIEQVVEIPVKDVVPACTLVAEGVGIINVSPLSLRFDHSGDGDIVDEEIARADYDKYFGERFGSFEDFLDGCYSEIDIDACSKIVSNTRTVANTSYTTT